MSLGRYCGCDAVHKFVRAPVEGLGGVKNGVMTMGQRKLKFIE